MAGDVVVDVLRRVRLVVGDEGADAKSKVLHEECIDRHCDFACVPHLDMPKPCGPVGEQAQRHAMADAPRQAFPRHPIVGDADSHGGAPANHLDVGRSRATRPQQDLPDAAVDRGGQDLIDQYCAVVASMLDGEHRTIRQDGNAEAGVVAEAAQTQILFPGRAPAMNIGGSHRVIHNRFEFDSASSREVLGCDTMTWSVRAPVSPCAVRGQDAGERRWGESLGRIDESPWC